MILIMNCTTIMVFFPTVIYYVAAQQTSAAQDNKSPQHKTTMSIEIANDILLWSMHCETPSGIQSAIDIQHH